MKSSTVSTQQLSQTGFLLWSVVTSQRRHIFTLQVYWNLCLNTSCADTGGGPSMQAVWTLCCDYWQLCWHVHLEKNLQVYDAPAQGLSQVEDGVLNCIFFSIKVQDLFVQRSCRHNDVINVIVLWLVLHLLQGFAQLIVLSLQQLDISVDLSLVETQWSQPRHVWYSEKPKTENRRGQKQNWKRGETLTTSWSSLDTISSSFWCPFFRSSSVRFRASSSAWALSISSFILQRSLSLTAEIRDARMVSSPMVPSLLWPEEEEV